MQLVTEDEDERTINRLDLMTFTQAGRANRGGDGGDWPDELVRGQLVDLHALRSVATVGETSESALRPAYYFHVIARTCAFAHTPNLMSSAGTMVNAPSGTIRVAIVEDDPSIREGLAYLIERSEGFQCVAAYADAEEAVVGLPERQPDVVLMDIQLPGMSGIECIRRLRQQHPAMQIMMLTVLEDHDRIFQSLAAGASGYLLKKTPPVKLLNAIRDLHAGGSPMSNQIARRVVDAFRAPAQSATSMANLSVREHEILGHLAQGLLYKEIAEKLEISLETVRTHVRNIYQKLHVRSRTEAVLKVFKRPGA